MKIYIPTSGRATRREQKTLNCIEGSKKLLKSTTIVVQAGQEPEYSELAKDYGVKMMVLPPEIKTISPTRQYIMDQNKGLFCMVDDDLLFFRRRKDDPTKFLKLAGEEIEEPFDVLESRMKEENAAHGSILIREGANRITGKPTVYNTRMIRVLAVDAKIARKIGARYDRLQFKQDFDMILQLLRAGYPNLVVADYVQGQYGDGCSNAPGGCSVYRTPELMAETSRKLAELHPGFVKVVEKKTSTSWGGQTRVDVQVAWKKAFESSQR